MRVTWNREPVLSIAPFEHPAMNYDFLRAEGIRHLEGVKNPWNEMVEMQNVPLYYHASEKTLSLQGDALTAEPVYICY